MKKTLLVVVAALMLAGCDSVKHGTITEKNYHAAWTDTWTSKYPALHPESFEFCLKATNGDRGCVDVPHDEYNRYKIGDKYP